MKDATTANPSDFIGSFESSLLPNTGPLARIHVLENEIEAHVLHDVLQNAAIPHTIECYRDAALDGLYQTVRGWGGVITREEDVARALDLIKRALSELLSQDAEVET